MQNDNTQSIDGQGQNSPTQIRSGDNVKINAHPGGSSAEATEDTRIPVPRSGGRKRKPSWFPAAA